MFFSRLNLLVPRPLQISVVAFVVLALAGTNTVIETAGPIAWAVTRKIQGRAEFCPWNRMFTVYSDRQALARLRDESRNCVRVEAYDESFGIELISHAMSSRRFWIRRSGDGIEGKELLADLIADYQWVAAQSEAGIVRSGDIVLDCGAHVGVFADLALRSGAQKVVAIDPDPVQLECLRRNFFEEIDAGRVIIVPKAVWSSETALTLQVGAGNSGMSSVVKDRGGEELTVEATTIDRLAAELSLSKVDAIKLDIEGAEREALRGAFETLKSQRPRLLIDTYHREDDMVVLPEIIAAANPDYHLNCGPCVMSDEVQGRNLVPSYVIYE